MYAMFGHASHHRNGNIPNPWAGNPVVCKIQLAITIGNVGTRFQDLLSGSTVALQANRPG